MDAHLASLESTLASQYGLVTMDQLRDEGLTKGLARGLVERKVLRRLRPRVYALVGSTESWERGLLAVLLSAPNSTASHSAAARLWAFEPRPEDRYEITVDRHCYVRIPEVSVHRSATITDVDIVTKNGIRVTSFERTLSDCTTLMSQHQAGRALDNGLRRGVASLVRLRDCAERNESGPGRHMSTIRALLAERGIGFDPGGSRSELQILDVFRRAGVPTPVQQHAIRVDGRVYRPDFAWPDVMVFAEYYGLPFHTPASAVISDSERLTALSAAGWKPLILTQASTDAEIIKRTTEALHPLPGRREKC